MIWSLVPEFVNSLGWMLLAFVGVLIPILIVRSSRRLGSGRLTLSRPRFYRQTVTLQLILAALSAWVAWTHGILAIPLPQRPLLSWGVAALLYVITVLALRFRWPGRSAASKQRLYDILPHDRGELTPYVLVCVVAGVAEELIYRGVMTQLLQRVVGVAILTVILVSISFAVAHAMQGWRSVASIFVIALGCHGLVWLAQSLLPVMAVHAAYDFTAGILIPRLFESEAVSAPTGAAG